MEALGRVRALPPGVPLEKRDRAVWNGTVVAQSAHTVVVDGNHYFPLAGVRMENLRASASHTTCYWKGEASYYDVVVGDRVNKDAAWYYPDPSPAAARLKDRVAFWHGVNVELAEPRAS